jgi:hypothetical protein
MHPYRIQKSGENAKGIIKYQLDDGDQFWRTCQSRALISCWLIRLRARRHKDDGRSILEGCSEQSVDQLLTSVVSIRDDAPIYVPPPLHGALEYHAEQLCYGIRKSGKAAVDDLRTLLDRLLDEILTGHRKSEMPGESKSGHLGSSSSASVSESAVQPYTDALHTKLEALDAKLDTMKTDAGDVGKDEAIEESSALVEGTPAYTEAMATQMFNMMEQTADGEIDLARAASFIKRAGIITMSPEEVATKYDEDGNGKICIDEFLVIVKDLHSGHTTEDVVVSDDATPVIEEVPVSSWTKRPIHPE